MVRFEITELMKNFVNFKLIVFIYKLDFTFGDFFIIVFMASEKLRVLNFYG